MVHAFRLLLPFKYTLNYTMDFVKIESMKPYFLKYYQNHKWISGIHSHRNVSKDLI